MAVYKNSVPFGNIVTNGLVLNLDATNINSYPGSGTTWYDTSFYRNNGTLTNGPTFLQERGRGSIGFDGVDDYVNCGTITQITGLVDLTVSAWVYPVTASTTRYISRYYNTNSDNGFVLYSFPSGSTSIKIGFDGRESAAAYLSTTSSLAYSVNQWYNIVGTKNQNNWRTYINGVLGSSDVIGIGTTAFLPNTLQVGALLTNFSPFYTKSNISTAQIYNRALSAQEVTQNYNALKSRFNL